MVRVAIFTDNDFGKTNGVTTTLKAVLRFARGDAEPRVYTAAGAGLDTSPYFAASSIGIGLPFYRDMRVYWPRLQTFAREIRRQGATVLHVTTPGPIGGAAHWLAWRLRLPLVGSYHTELGEYATALTGLRLMGYIGEHYLRAFYRRSDPLLVPSVATRDRLIARGYRANRLRVWGRGVDVETFSPRRAFAPRRHAWTAGDRRPVILYAGRLSPEKGLDLVAPIRQALLRHGLNHQFVFAGDGPMRRELEARCPDGIFLGTLPHDDVAVAMACADLLLFPSATDTMGNVVLEAQAAGLPVVVSDRGGPQQNMRAGDTGFVCRAGLAEDFAAAVIALLTETRRRRQMGAAARAYAETRDWPRSMAPLVDAWHEADRRVRARRPLPIPDRGPGVLTGEASR